MSDSRHLQFKLIIVGFSVGVVVLFLVFLWALLGSDKGNDLTELVQNARNVIQDGGKGMSEREIHRYVRGCVLGAGHGADRLDVDAEGFILDWWGTRFRIGHEQRGSVSFAFVLSAGRDREFGTFDDLRAERRFFR